MRECKRCICNDTFPDIHFDDEGICNYCRLHEELDRQYLTGKEGRRQLERIADGIKKNGKNRQFDCVVGVSGGKDSSFLLHLACDLGLRPVAVHYDNGWDDPIATRNIQIMTSALQVSLINYRVRQEEVDDLIKAFLFSHTQDAEAATDLGLTKCLFQVATKYGVKYILDGHSFRTEGFAPLAWSYMDGRYVRSVHASLGRVPLRTYPMLNLIDQIWYGLKGIKRPRLLYYLDYHSEKTRRFLEDVYGWKWYGGHHLENIYTAFFDYYYRQNKLGYDGRFIELSALIRSGQITKEQALERFDNEGMTLEQEDFVIKEIKRRLKIDERQFKIMMFRRFHKKNTDWPTYRKHFKMLKPVFWAMVKTKRIPDSFYIKYCKG